MNAKRMQRSWTNVSTAGIMRSVEMFNETREDRNQWLIISFDMAMDRWI